MQESSPIGPVHFEDVQKHGGTDGSPSWSCQMGPAMGARELGMQIVELGAGEPFCPYHYHLGNEEALYVMEGTGILRLEDGEHEIRAGHFAAFPRGKEGAHKILNNSKAPLRILLMSTMREPDICVYPDSRKVNLFGGSAPGGDLGERSYSKILDEDAVLQYWDREEK